MRQVYPLVASVGLQRAKARTKPKGGPPFSGSRPSESSGRQGERGSGDQSDSRPPVLQTQPSNPITPPVTRPPDARPGEQRLQPEAHPVGPQKCRTATESAGPDIIVTGRSPTRCFGNIYTSRDMTKKSRQKGPSLTSLSPAGQPTRCFGDINTSRDMTKEAPSESSTARVRTQPVDIVTWRIRA